MPIAKKNVTPSSTPSPAEQLATETQDLRGRLNSIQNQTRLATVRDEIEDLETSTGGLEERVRGLRARGYAFEKDLEPRVAEIRKRWSSLRLQLNQAVNSQVAHLEREERAADALLNQLASRASSPTLARPVLAQTQSAVSALESRVSAAEKTLRGMFDSYAQEMAKTKRHLDEVDWMLKQLAEATFKLLATECGIMAVEAVWAKDGKEDGDDPRGVLYLTDQRLLFEQKQEVATKKILFITTEKKMLQELALNVPLALLQEVKPSKGGLFKNEDHLDLAFATGAPFPKLHFHIDGQDCHTWHALLGQASSGALDTGRAVAIDTEAVEKVRSAPGQCPACGGTVNQPVLRGMDSLTCQYCGYVMRLG